MAAAPRPAARRLAALAGLALRSAPAARAAPAPVELRISPDIVGRASGRLVGFGVEDVNHELYGGLYSQMVYGEDFEEPAGPSGVSGDLAHAPRGLSPTWTPVGAQGAAPSFETVSSNVFNGRQAQLLVPGPNASAAILNRGLYRQGLHLRPGSGYEGYLFARAAGGAAASAASVSVSLVALRGALPYAGGSGVLPASELAVLASEEFALEAGGRWTRVDFALDAGAGADCEVLAAPAACPGAVRTPEGECVLCRGGLLVAARGGAAALDFVFLQPGAWGRFEGLPVRADAARALQDVGVRALRLGGSTCNVPGWRWKNMRGPREHRAPYAGEWHPFASQGWRIFEFLALCEKLGALAVVTLNNEESPEDLADLVEYAHGGPGTAWGRARAADGRAAPFAAFVVEIGNEQQLDYRLVRQVSEGAEAMRIRAGVIGLDRGALRFAIGHNLDMAMINTPVCDAMVNATKFLGPTVMWDLHVDGDTPDQEDHWAATFDMALRMLDRLGSQMRLAVFEENAFRHDLVRGLNRARYANAYARLGDRFEIGTAANGLQVLGRNDNGWDQGAVFLAPDRAWLSPFGHAARLVARSSQPVVLRCRLRQRAATGRRGAVRLDAHAARAEDGSAVVARVVNYDPDRSAALTIALPRTIRCAGGALVAILAAPAGGNASAVNPPSDPLRVSPRERRVDEVRDITLGPMSLLTARWAGCAAWPRPAAPPPQVLHV